MRKQYGNKNKNKLQKIIIKDINMSYKNLEQDTSAEDAQAIINKGNRRMSELQTKKAELIKRMENLVESAGNELTSQEQEVYNKLKADVQVLDERLKRPVPVQKEEENKSSETWIDSTGKKIRVYSPDEKVGSGKLNFGKYIKGCLTGSWHDAQAEHEIFATTTGNLSAGGYLMPTTLQQEFIDLLRQKAVLVNAGARTVLLDSHTDKIARILTDPTAEIKTELESFNATNPTLDLVSFTPFTLGCYVQVSEELLADAQNLADILQNTMSAAVGQKLDLMGLYGSGSGESLGLCNYSDINSVPVTTWSYDTILDGLEENETNNSYSSSVYVCSPAISTTLAKLKDKNDNYIVKPDEVRALRKLVSTICNDADLVIGDFSNLIIGIRAGMMFEGSKIADDSFKKYAYAFRVVMRADVQVVRPKSFCLCSTDLS